MSKSKREEQQPEHLSIYSDRGVTRIDVHDQTLTGAAEVNRFAREVSEGVSRLNNPKVVMNCACLTWVSSRMLGILVEMDRKLKARKGRLCLSNLTPAVTDVFHVTRLSDQIAIHLTVDEAIQSFG